MTAYELEHRLRGLDPSLEIKIGDGSDVVGFSVTPEGRYTGRVRTEKDGQETFPEQAREVVLLEVSRPVVLDEGDPNPIFD